MDTADLKQGYGKEVISRKALIIGAVTSALLAKRVQAREEKGTRNVSALEAALRRPNTLAGIAARGGLLYGTCAYKRDLVLGGYTYDPTYKALILRECSSIVPGYGMGPDATRKTADGFDFSLVESLASLAAENEMVFNGGGLVWHDAVPAWVKSSLTDRSSIMSEMLLEVTTPISHFGRQADTWIVVNEVINVRDRVSNGLRNSYWLQQLGPDYIPAAFAAARKANPDAKLLINEYGIEADSPDDEQKREALLKLIRSLRHDGVPLDALGIQSHLWGDRRIDPSILTRFLDDIHSLGMTVYITELDVRDQNLPSDIAARDVAVAKTISDFLTVVVPHPATVAITSWGLSDNHSWYNRYTPKSMQRSDGLPERGTLFDQSLMPKLAYKAVEDALKLAIPTSRLKW